MLILPPTKLRIDKWLNQSSKCAACVLACSIVGLFLVFFFYSSEKIRFTMEKVGSQAKRTKTHFPYESIGGGGLALHSRHALGWVSRLANELALIAYNSRPDVEAPDAKILISLKHGKEQLTLSNGRRLYLKESERGRGLLSSDDQTGLWVKPILLENGAILVEAGRRLGEGEENGQFIVASQGGVPSCYNSNHQPFAVELKTARCFSQDLLIQKYGGREYSSLKDKRALYLSKGTTAYACFVSAGDYLMYDQGEWCVSSYESLKSERPIAYVKAMSSRAIEVEAWDETGFYPLHFKVEVESIGRLQQNPEVMPTRIRLRNSSQVSCALGKRRVILREGDWLLKTSTGWRNLRRSDEIELYLNHRVKGELFIFDAIEKEQGQLVVKGHLFDETRTQVLSVTLPIDVEKQPGKTSRRRKPMQTAKGRAG